MAKLDIIQEALGAGVQRGALIHEKTGITQPVEVVMAEDDRLLAIVQCTESGLERLHPSAKVRVEIPRDNAVILIQGRVRECRAERACELVEVDLDCLNADLRQRRMDVRIASSCRIRIGGEDGAWDETRTLNISAGGALVVCESRAAVGERVEVEFELDGEIIRCSAEVLRRGVKIHGAHSRTNAALKFIGLSEAQREKIQLFVLREQAIAKLERHR